LRFFKHSTRSHQTFPFLPVQIFFNRYIIDAVVLHYVTKASTLYTIPDSAFQGNTICNVLTFILSVSLLSLGIESILRNEIIVVDLFFFCFISFFAAILSALECACKQKHCLISSMVFSLLWCSCQIRKRSMQKETRLSSLVFRPTLRF